MYGCGGQAIIVFDAATLSATCDAFIVTGLLLLTVSKQALYRLISLNIPFNCRLELFGKTITIVEVVGYPRYHPSSPHYNDWILSSL